MKLLSFEAGGEARVGAALPDRVIDLTRALAATHPEVRCADSMLGIIRSGIDIDAIGGKCIRRLAADEAAIQLCEFRDLLSDGPWIVTAAELCDPSNPRVEVRINGEVRRSGTTADMIFNPFEVPAYCSDYTPMEAGDIISLGIYGGRKRIAAGDVIEMETEGIGVLRNRVVKARAPWRNFAMDKPTGPFVRQTR
jgi:hypothetical protein